MYRVYRIRNPRRGVFSLLQVTTRHNKQHDAEFSIWLAGFIDGEGSLSISRRNPCPKSKNKNPSCCISLTITNTKLDILVDIAKRYDGNIVPVKNRTNTNQSPCYRFIAYRKKAHQIIRDVYPYLRVKRKQADVLLQYEATTPNKRFGRGGIPDNVMSLRENYVAEIRTLNKRGIENAQSV